MLLFITFIYFVIIVLDLIQFSSVAQSCPPLCDPMDCSTPGLPVHHQLPEFIQTHVHWVSHAIQPSHLLLSPYRFNYSSPILGLIPWLEDSLEKRMATHSSTLVWGIPWTEEPRSLQSMGLRRVRHDWATFTCSLIWNRKGTMLINSLQNKYRGIPWWSSS